MSFDLQNAVRDAKPGAVVTVPAGTYAVNLLIDKPLSLVGLGEVVLDGQRSGSVLRVNTDGVVKLGGLLIVGGRTNSVGGGVSLERGELDLVQCTLRFNEAPVHGGGGLGIRAGHARVTACRFEANTGRQGAGVLVDAEGKLTMRDCLLAQNAGFDGGGIRVKESGSATLLGCTLADNRVLGEGAAGSAIFTGGSSTRAPVVTLRHCVLSERAPGPSFLENLPAAKATLHLDNCLLPGWCQALGGDNLFAAAAFTLEGHEPYRLGPDSPGAHAASDGAFAPLAKDLTGHSRTPRPGLRQALGAFALAQRSSGAYDSTTEKIHE